MMVVPHDQPITTIRGAPRFWRMKSAAALTSLTAVSVRTMAGLFCAGSSISFGRVERPYPRTATSHTPNPPGGVEGPYVEPALGDVIHPGSPAERQVECRLRRVGRAVHEEQDLFRAEL